jgi:hypothetical protein
VSFFFENFLKFFGAFFNLKNINFEWAPLARGGGACCCCGARWRPLIADNGVFGAGGACGRRGSATATMANSPSEQEQQGEREQPAEQHLFLHLNF